MAETFKIKRNDTKPYLAVTFKDSVGSAIDLTNASGISFNMTSDNNVYTSVLSGNCVVTGSTSGQTEYRWAAGDTNRSGTYLGEFEITYDDGTVETFPADHSLKVKIYEDYD